MKNTDPICTFEKHHGLFSDISSQLVKNTWGRQRNKSQQANESVGLWLKYA